MCNKSIFTKGNIGVSLWDMSKNYLKINLALFILENYFGLFYLEVNNECFSRVS